MGCFELRVYGFPVWVTIVVGLWLLDCGFCGLWVRLWLCCGIWCNWLWLFACGLVAFEGLAIAYWLLVCVLWLFGVLFG